MFCRKLIPIILRFINFRIKLADNLPNYGFCQAAVRSLFDPSMWRSNSHRQRTMQAVMLISNVCDQHQLYPSDEAMERRQIEKVLNQWREEFLREREKEQKDEAELDSGYYAEMLHLLDCLQHSLLRFYVQ